MISEAPAFHWKRDREAFGPLIVRSAGRGVLHRAQPGPRVHVRCSGGRPFLGGVLTPEEAREYATGRPAILCRYPWCFRAVVEAAGFDPSVGHAVRRVGLPREPRLRGEDGRHRPAPERPHEFVEGWAWCSCGWIVVRNESPHRPGNVWWSHKGRRAAA